MNTLRRPVKHNDSILGLQVFSNMIVEKLPVFFRTLCGQKTHRGRIGKAD